MSEEGDLSSLPVSDQESRDGVEVSVSSLQKSARSHGKLLHEVFSGLPLFNSVDLLKLLSLSSLEELIDVAFGVLEFLCSHNSFKHDIGLSIIRVVHDTGTIDEVNSLGESDVLPNLGLSGNRSNLTDVLLSEGVDHGTLSNIGVSDETN